MINLANFKRIACAERHVWYPVKATIVTVGDRVCRIAQNRTKSEAFRVTHVTGAPDGVS